jgi:hypothetical protein
MSKEIFKYRLSPFALSVVEEDRKYYYQQLEHLKCHDPLAIPLPLFKCGKVLKTIIPSIEKYHLVQYLVFEKNKDEEGRREAYKNLDSEQYLSNTFTDKLLALTLSNLVVLIRTHVTHSQSLNLPKARPWAALKNDGTQSMSSVICRYAGLPIKKQVLFYLNDYKCNNKLPETK